MHCMFTTYVATYVYIQNNFKMVDLVILVISLTNPLKFTITNVTIYTYVRTNCNVYGVQYIIRSLTHLLQH